MRICPGDAVENGGRAWRFVIRLGRRRRAAFVVRHDGVVRAFVNECAHIPVGLDMDDGRVFDESGRWLICATHGARYDPVDGVCLAGPCGSKGLIPLAVVEKDGYILLKESHIRLEGT